jgi:hypothetical protein
MKSSRAKSQVQAALAGGGGVGGRDVGGGGGRGGGRSGARVGKEEGQKEISLESAKPTMKGDTEAPTGNSLPRRNGSRQPPLAKEAVAVEATMSTSLEIEVVFSLLHCTFTRSISYPSCRSIHLKRLGIPLF